jgi:hypothetical protein
MEKALENNQVYSWVIYGSSEKDMPQILREVDNIFSDYSFYPEIDWLFYGYKPPLGYEVLGAWRHPEKLSFAFLLDNPRMVKKPNLQLIIYINSDRAEINELETKFYRLKSRFSLKEKQENQSIYISQRISSFQKFKYSGILLSILAIFTAIVNAFSLYLRKLPYYQIDIKWMSDCYHIFLWLFHIIAMLFLINFVIFCVSFLIKYGILLIRRL